ncbi:hypothetical protein Ping_3165 [Psychromonas ingrahamii 37]|uniref:Uncharacterized protein n=1 Tax=Psychromonas ingrahamii (strain DSM 17664 / CCUG 51855 / 37) TaxID=357804 RepID=A1SZD8_PSYIN|nr:hypothetical protein Ping_3165 [Psychromonas ingrahamii 37]
MISIIPDRKEGDFLFSVSHHSLSIAIKISPILVTRKRAALSSALNNKPSFIALGSTRSAFFLLSELLL